MSDHGVQRQLFQQCHLYKPATTKVTKKSPWTMHGSKLYCQGQVIQVFAGQFDVTVQRSTQQRWEQIAGGLLQKSRFKPWGIVV